MKAVEVVCAHSVLCLLAHTALYEDAPGFCVHLLQKVHQ